MYPFAEFFKLQWTVGECCVGFAIAWLYYLNYINTCIFHQHKLNTRYFWGLRFLKIFFFLVLPQIKVNGCSQRAAVWVTWRFVRCESYFLCNVSESWDRHTHIGGGILPIYLTCRKFSVQICWMDGGGQIPCSMLKNIKNQVQKWINIFTRKLSLAWLSTLSLFVQYWNKIRLKVDFSYSF